MLSTPAAALRTFVMVPLFFLYTLVLAAVILVYATINSRSPVHDRIVNHWARLFLRIPPVAWSVEGLEHIHSDTRYVVASNHLSMFDIPLLFAALPVDGRFLAKKELFRIPLVGRAMRTIGIIEIDREAGGSSRQAIADGVQLAAERGYSLLVFPEGTRSDDGALLPFKKGAFRIAIDTGLPLLPVVIEGTDRVSRKHSKLFHRGTARVRILPPIETASKTNRDHLNPLVRDVEASITSVYEQLRSESSAAHQS